MITGYRSWQVVYNKVIPIYRTLILHDWCHHFYFIFLFIIYDFFFEEFISIPNKKDTKKQNYIYKRINISMLSWEHCTLFYFLKKQKTKKLSISCSFLRMFYVFLFLPSFPRSLKTVSSSLQNTYGLLRDI